MTPGERGQFRSRRIHCKAEGVSRVTCDISSKPPATMEWEQVSREQVFTSGSVTGMRLCPTLSAASRAVRDGDTDKTY